MIITLGIRVLRALGVGREANSETVGVGPVWCGFPVGDRVLASSPGAARDGAPVSLKGGLLVDEWVELNPMRREDWREALKLVRWMELRPGGVVWSPLLDALEVDRPPLASKRAVLEVVPDLEPLEVDE